MLQEALERQNLRVRVTALVNDTVGTLLAHSYRTGQAAIGAIYGTGTNGAYIERVDRFNKLDQQTIQSFNDAPTIICNTEWGATDNARKALKITSFDNKVDRQSINPFVVSSCLIQNI